MTPGPTTLDPQSRRPATTPALLAAGVIALPNFFLWTWLFDHLRADYDHRHKAVSELGALGAPNMAWMNLLAFLGTGALLVCAAAGLRRTAALGRTAALLLLAAGVLFMCTAVPLSMGTGPDPDPDLGTVTSLIHTVSALGGALVWVAAILVTAIRGRGALQVAGISGLLGIAAVFLASAVEPLATYPGLAQRLNFAVLLGWTAAVSAIAWPSATGHHRLHRL